MSWRIILRVAPALDDATEDQLLAALTDEQRRWWRAGIQRYGGIDPALI